MNKTSQVCDKKKQFIRRNVYDAVKHIIKF